MRARNPSGLALVSCTLSAVDNVTENNVGVHEHTQTEKVVQGTLPSYAIRYEEGFFPVMGSTGVRVITGNDVRG